MPLSLRSVLVGALCLALLCVHACPTSASCINCYGNYCGDRSQCCGASGELQTFAAGQNVAPCDGLDALCQSHDNCVAMYGNTTASPCVCDDILRSGLAKAQNDSAFDFRPQQCAVTSSVGGGCKSNCQLDNAFSLATAGMWLGLDKPCACVMGERAGTVTADTSYCTGDQSIIKDVICREQEASYMADKGYVTCWQCLAGCYWPGCYYGKWYCGNSGLECVPGKKCYSAVNRRLLSVSEVELGTNSSAVADTAVDACMEDDSSAAPPADCSAELITSGLSLIPDACGCIQRDLRCLMEQGVYTGTCKAHVDNLLRCTNSSNPQLAAIRTMIKSRDFDSVSFDDTSTPTVEAIRLNIWLPILCVLSALLAALSIYMTARTRQYKRRIDLLNSSNSSGRSTGFSIMASDLPVQAADAQLDEPSRNTQ